MCMFNTGCPGWLDVPGYEDGYTPCDEELGCATDFAESCKDLHNYLIESHERFDRYAMKDGTIKWFCGDCGEEIDPDNHENCHIHDKESNNEDE